MDQLAEKIERLALEEVHSCTTQEIRQALGLKFITTGQGFISIASELPQSAIVMNRALGNVHDLAGIEQAVSAYKEVGVERYFLSICQSQDNPELVHALKLAGLQKARGWQKFVRGTDPVVQRPTSFDIIEIGQDQGRDAAEIICHGFDLGASAQDWLARLPICPNWHVFVAYDQAVPIATGSLYIYGDAAWTDFGVTKAAHRQKGCQAALLNHRIQYALDRGCSQIFSCTGEDVPGDPQHSYRNILKAGFTETYVRDNYAPLPKPSLL